MRDDVLKILPVEPAMWAEFEELFEERGGPKSCWCMVWRDYARTSDVKDKTARKSGMRDRIVSGQKVGLMGFLGGEAIAWCSVAPRRSFKKSLDRIAPPDDCDAWSLTCLFIKRAHRGKGLSAKLIEAAVHYAQSQGATTLDAYPVDAESPSYRFCGFKPQFDSRGFETVGAVGSRRYLVRRML